MPVRRFILQVSGRQSPDDLAGIDASADHVTASSVLRVHLRDQAALQGLLRRLHGLGLNLVDLHEAEAPSSPAASGRDFEVTVDGPVGELVETTLCDYVGPVHVSSRYTFVDAVVMGKVLTRLLGRGADLEYAGTGEGGSPPTGEAVMNGDR